MKASEVLRQARDTMVSHGWTRFALVRDSGAHCATGAIAAALGVTDDQMCEEEDRPIYTLVANSEAGSLLINEILLNGEANVIYDSRINTTWQWNDAAESFDAVLDLFNTAIAAAEAKGR